MTRVLTSTTICFALFSACASAHAEEVVIHERATKECRVDRSGEWKLEGEQQLGQCELRREGFDKLLANVGVLAREARFVPSMRDGKPNGFKIDAIVPSSIFALLGFQNRDTILTLNGDDLSTPDTALEVFAKLRSASQFVVTGERGGAPFTIDITITP
jgi:membrane-associated protease RseP (regulator of RpoE activity)